MADALHCNPNSAEAVVKSGANYLFVVKDNQRNLKEDIELYVKTEVMESFSTVEKNGGRIETRTGYVCNDIEWLDDKGRFKNLSCIGAIKREFEKKGEISSQWHYYISSTNLTAENLLKHARAEWRVESMHWLLDVHYSEDKTRVRDMELQKNLNIMRKIALNLAKQYKGGQDKEIAMSKILKRNLFDLNNFHHFLTFLRENYKLD